MMQDFSFLTTYRITRGIAAIAVVMFLSVSGLLASNTSATYSDSQSVRMASERRALRSPERQVLTEFQGHRVYKVLPASYQDEEIIIAGDTQWCWKQSCTHVGITCEGGTATDINGCTVRCTWGASTLDVECPPR